MTIVDAFISTGVEVMGDIALKTVSREDQSQKKNQDGLPGWVVTVLVPEGRKITDYKVTVWNASRPMVADTDKVIFSGLNVGAYQSGNSANLYFHAANCEIHFD